MKCPPEVLAHTGNNGKRDADPKCKANLQQTTKSRETEVFLPRNDERIGGVEGEGGDGTDAGGDVKEEPHGFSDAFAEDAGPTMLEVEFSLRDRFGGDDLTEVVFLDGFSGAEFMVVNLEAVEVHVGYHVGGGFCGFLAS